MRHEHRREEEKPVVWPRKNGPGQDLAGRNQGAKRCDLWRISVCECPGMMFGHLNVLKAIFKKKTS